MGADLPSPNPVIDNGCPSSIAGLRSAAALADCLNIPLDLRPILQPFMHYFGPKNNCTEAKITVAKWLLPVTFDDGFVLKVPVACVQGDDPLLLGNDFLDRCVIDNIKGKLIYHDTKGQQHACPFHKQKDGHAYLQLCRKEQGAQQYALYQRDVKTLQQRQELLRCLHRRTHAAPAAMRMLLQRNHIWHPTLNKHVEEIYRKCDICSRTGEPLPARKVSTAHIDCSFNASVGVDFFYWQRSPARTVLCLHAICLGTALSEVQPVESREMRATSSIVETIWVHQHVSPTALGFDPEFNNVHFLKMLSRNGITAQPRPARRHNKMGRTERKHRSIKLILSRLALAYPEENDTWLVKFAVFLSNVFAGYDQLASAFELARGYTPSLMGTKMMRVPSEIIEAHKDLMAKRALNRILRTKAVTPVAPNILTPGTQIYGYVKLQKGQAKWCPFSVIRCDGRIVEVRRASRGPKMLLALEDVRLRPQNPLGRRLVEHEMGVPEHLEEPDYREATAEPLQTVLLRRPHELNEEYEQRTDNTEQPNLNKPGETEEVKATVGAPNANDTALVGEFPETHGETDEPTNAQSPERTIAQEMPASMAGSNLQKELDLPDVANEPKQPVLRRSTRERKPSYKCREVLTSGNAEERSEEIRGKTLQSTEQKVLAQLYQKYGSEQFTQSAARGIPDWAYAKALEAELKNWEGHYQQCSIAEIPPGSNIVGSHVVYRIKKNEDGNFRFKARLVVHGNEDASKDDIRKDATTAHLTTIRLILSLAVCYGFQSGQIDIKAAYFQSGPIRRRIYVRPPRDLLLFRILWLLLSLPYGIVEAGRQWQLTSDDFLHSIGLQTVSSLPQCFIRKENGKLVLIVGKVVDDFLVAGTPEALRWFSRKINSRFTVGAETYTPHALKFNGAIIEKDSEGSIRVNMNEFANKLAPFSFERSRRKQTEASVNAEELHDYQSLAGKLNWLGHSVLPHATFAASYLQQQVGDLKVKHLMNANGALREIKRWPPVLVFGRPKEFKPAKLCTFADAAFPKIEGSVYGQTGILTGLVLGEGPDAAFHPLGWSSHKQSRVSRSASAAEILSIVEAEEFGAAIKMALETITGERIPHELNVDSRSLYDTITTQHEAKDFRLRQAVRSLRERYELGDISALRWIAGKANPADALTKRGASTAELLSSMSSKGRLSVNFGQGMVSTNKRFSPRHVRFSLPPGIIPPSEATRSHSRNM